MKIAGCAILTAGQLATVLALITAFEVMDISDSENPPSLCGLLSPCCAVSAEIMEIFPGD